jgi:hypothetical protein
MAKVTEADVISYYSAYVLQECQNSYKGMEIEDRIAEGTLAVLYAIRTYKKHFGAFEDYLASQLTIIMKNKNKEAWTIKKLESIFSLDAPLTSNSDSSVFLNFVKSLPHDETILDVNSFLSTLSPIEKQVVAQLLDGKELKELSSELALPNLQVEIIIKDLQRKIRSYFCLEDE